MRRKHGYVGYAVGCRCRVCTEAWRVQGAEYRARRAARLAAGEAPSDLEHGKYSTYVNWCCRCGSCSDAAREARAK